MVLSFIVARYFRLPWILHDRFSPDTIHNMLVPINMSHPDDLLVTTTQLGLRFRGWTHFNERPLADEYLCLFSCDVCCIVTFEGLIFLSEHVPLA
jgi:hypothetical protein